MAGAVEEGPAAVSGVDGRVGLDDPVDGPPGVTRLNLAAQTADDPGGQGVVQTERVADGVHALPHQQVGARPDGKRAKGRDAARGFHGAVLPGKLFGVVNLKDGDVLVRVEPDYFGGIDILFLRRDPQLARSVDDVKVGDHVPAVVPDDAGPSPGGSLDGVEGEHVPSLLQVGDVHDGGRVGVE